MNIRKKRMKIMNFLHILSERLRSLMSRVNLSDLDKSLITKKQFKACSVVTLKWSIWDVAIQQLWP